MESKDLGGGDQEDKKQSRIFPVLKLPEAKARMQEAGYDGAKVEKVEADSVAAPEKLESLVATEMEKFEGENLEGAATDENKSLEETPVMIEETRKDQPGEATQTEHEETSIASPVLAAELQQGKTVEDKGNEVVETDKIGLEDSKGSVDQSQDLQSMETNEINNACEQTKESNDGENRASPLAMQIELPLETKVSGFAEGEDCLSSSEMKGEPEKVDDDNNISVGNAVQKNEIQKPDDVEKTDAENMQPREPEVSVITTNDCANTLAATQNPANADVKIDYSKSEVSSANNEESGGTRTQVVTDPGLGSVPVEEGEPKPSEKVDTSGELNPTIDETVEQVTPPAIESAASGAADANSVKVPSDSAPVTSESESVGGCIEPEVFLKEQSSNEAVGGFPCAQVSSDDIKLHSSENIGGCDRESDIIKEATAIEVDTPVSQQAENPTSDVSEDAVNEVEIIPKDDVNEGEIIAKDGVNEAQIIAKDAVNEAQIIAKDLVNEAHIIAKDVVNESQIIVKDAVNEASTGAVDAGTENPTDSEAAGCSSEKTESTGPVEGASEGEQGYTTSEESRPSSCVPPLKGLNLSDLNLTLRSLEDMWKIVPKGFKNSIAPEVQCQRKPTRPKKSEASGDSAPSNDDDSKEEKRGKVPSQSKKNDCDKGKENRKQRKEDKKLPVAEVTEETEKLDGKIGEVNEDKVEASAAPTTAIANESEAMNEKPSFDASASDSYSSEAESDLPLGKKWTKAGKKDNFEENKKPGITPPDQSENKLPSSQKRTKGGRKKQAGENVRENVQSVPIMKERTVPRNPGREYTVNPVETSGQQFPLLFVPPLALQGGHPEYGAENQKQHVMGSHSRPGFFSKPRFDHHFDGRNMKGDSPMLKFRGENHPQQYEDGCRTKACRNKGGTSARQQATGMSNQEPVLYEKNQHPGNFDIAVQGNWSKTSHDKVQWCLYKCTRTYCKSEWMMKSEGYSKSWCVECRDNNYPPSSVRPYRNPEIMDQHGHPARGYFRCPHCNEDWNTNDHKVGGYAYCLNNNCPSKVRVYPYREELVYPRKEYRGKRN